MGSSQSSNLSWNLFMAICIIAFAVFAVISLLMFNPWAAMLVMVIVIITTIELGGFMGIVGIKMNPISAVTLICAVGIGKLTFLGKIEKNPYNFRRRIHRSRSACIPHSAGHCGRASGRLSPAHVRSSVPRCYVYTSGNSHVGLLPVRLRHQILLLYDVVPRLSWGI